MPEKILMTAIILAGGKSSRMGKDKSLLPFEGKTMLENIVALVEPFFEETLVIVDQEAKTKELDLSGAKVYEDLIKHQGPLGGIYTGFCYSNCSASCVLTCDMPLVDEFLIGRLIDLWEEGLDALCFKDASSHVQPFPGIYSRSSRFLVRTLLDRGECAMTRFMEVGLVKSITLEEEKSGAFTNLNTPADYHEVLKAKERRLER